MVIARRVLQRADQCLLVMRHRITPDYILGSFPALGQPQRLAALNMDRVARPMPIP
jgi:hypothetical protein